MGPETITTAIGDDGDLEEADDSKTNNNKIMVLLTNDNYLPNEPQKQSYTRSSRVRRDASPARRSSNRRPNKRNRNSKRNENRRKNANTRRNTRINTARQTTVFQRPLNHPHAILHPGGSPVNFNQHGIRFNHNKQPLAKDIVKHPEYAHFSNLNANVNKHRGVLVKEEIEPGEVPLSTLGVDTKNENSLGGKILMGDLQHIPIEAKRIIADLESNRLRPPIHMYPTVPLSPPPVMPLHKGGSLKVPPAVSQAHQINPIPPISQTSFPHSIHQIPHPSHVPNTLKLTQSTKPNIHNPIPNIHNVHSSFPTTISQGHNVKLPSFTSSAEFGSFSLPKNEDLTTSFKIFSSNSELKPFSSNEIQNLNTNFPGFSDNSNHMSFSTLPKRETTPSKFTMSSLSPNSDLKSFTSVPKHEGQPPATDSQSFLSNPIFSPLHFSAQPGNLISNTKLSEFLRPSVSVAKPTPQRGNVVLSPDPFMPVSNPHQHTIFHQDSQKHSFPKPNFQHKPVSDSHMTVAHQHENSLEKAILQSFSNKPMTFPLEFQPEDKTAITNSNLDTLTPHGISHSEHSQSHLGSPILNSHEPSAPSQPLSQSVGVVTSDATSSGKFTNEVVNQEHDVPLHNTQTNSVSGIPSPHPNLVPTSHQQLNINHHRGALHGLSLHPTANPVHPSLNHENVILDPSLSTHPTHLLSNPSIKHLHPTIGSINSHPGPGPINAQNEHKFLHSNHPISSSPTAEQPNIHSSGQINNENHQFSISSQNLNSQSHRIHGNVNHNILENGSKSKSPEFTTDVIYGTPVGRGIHTQNGNEVPHNKNEHSGKSHRAMQFKHPNDQIVVHQTIGVSNPSEERFSRSNADHTVPKSGKQPQSFIVNNINKPSVKHNAEHHSLSFDHNPRFNSPKDVVTFSREDALRPNRFTPTENSNERFVQLHNSRHRNKAVLHSNPETVIRDDSLQIHVEKVKEEIGNSLIDQIFRHNFIEQANPHLNPPRHYRPFAPLREHHSERTVDLRHQRNTLPVEAPAHITQMLPPTKESHSIHIDNSQNIHLSTPAEVNNNADLYTQNTHTDIVYPPNQIPAQLRKPQSASSVEHKPPRIGATNNKNAMSEHISKIEQHCPCIRRIDRSECNCPGITDTFITIRNRNSNPPGLPIVRIPFKDIFYHYITNDKDIIGEKLPSRKHPLNQIYEQIRRNSLSPDDVVQTIEHESRMTPSRNRRHRQKTRRGRMSTENEVFHHNEDMAFSVSEPEPSFENNQSRLRRNKSTSDDAALSKGSVKNNVLNFINKARQFNT